MKIEWGSTGRKCFSTCEALKPLLEWRNDYRPTSCIIQGSFAFGVARNNGGNPTHPIVTQSQWVMGLLWTGGAAVYNIGGSVERAASIR